MSKLANGLTLATTDRGGAAASVGIYVKAGSRHEVLPGTAHLLEHSAFHSTCVGAAVGGVLALVRCPPAPSPPFLPPLAARPSRPARRAQHPALDGQAAARH